MTQGKAGEEISHKNGGVFVLYNSVRVTTLLCMFHTNVEQGRYS